MSSRKPVIKYTHKALVEVTTSSDHVLRLVNQATVRKVKEIRVTQRQALMAWKTEAGICLQCFKWMNKRHLHYDTCRVCLNALFDDIFIDLRRPVILPDASLVDYPRPKEWKPEWFGCWWTDKGRMGVLGKAQCIWYDDYQWLMTEEELYNAYVAVIEGEEAFLKELNETSFTAAKVKRAITLLRNARLISKTKKLDYVTPHAE